MNDPAIALLRALLVRLVPAAHREALAGDLEERCRAHMRASATPSPLAWYLREFASSLPPLLWHRLRDGRWAATFGAALLAYVAVGVFQALLHAVLPFSTRAGGIASMLITWPVVAAIAALAERWQARAAPVLAGMMLAAMTAALLLTRESLPLLLWIAWFVGGPSAALVGRWLAHRRSRPRFGPGGAA